MRYKWVLFVLPLVVALACSSGPTKTKLTTPSNSPPKKSNTVIDSNNEDLQTKEAKSKKYEDSLLSGFVERAGEMGLEYHVPLGFSPTPLVDNVDVSYDYAIKSENGRLEMRFSLRPFPKDLPEPMRTLQFSWNFFQTGILNLIHGGNTGEAADPQPVPVEHFAADEAVMVVVRWFENNNEEKFFGNGFEGCSVVFMHREGIGDAYTFILFKDLKAAQDIHEELFHTLRFTTQ